jgi:anti-anti-sigma factor
MRITDHLEGDALVVAIHGEMDLRTWPQLEQLSERLRAHDGPVVVDTSGVSFCDSTALRFFIDLRTNVPELSLRDPSRELRIVLDTVGLLPAFRIEQPS